MRRALRLDKETLAELTPDDLAGVAGAANGITNVCGSDFAPCYPTYDCTLDCMVTLATC